MFASNNRISGRQVTRLLCFDLLGYGALMLPSVLAKEAGRDGIFSIGVGILMGLFYLLLLKALLGRVNGSYSDYLTQCCGRIRGGILKIGYILYFWILAGSVAATFAKLVTNELLEQKFCLILVLLLVLTFYSVIGGIEGRARAYEVLFWIVLLPLLFMMIYAAPQIEKAYWQPVFRATIGGVLRGGYETFMMVSVIFLLPFLSGYVKKQENLSRCGLWALLITGSILAALYMLLLGLFGSEALKTIEYPAVTMMSRIQITGGFLKRVDAIMFGIWFFTLFALLNSLVFFCGTLFQELTENILGLTNEAGSRKWLARGCILAVIAGVFVLADWIYRMEEVRNGVGLFLRFVGTPYIVLVPVVLLLKPEERQTKVVAAVLGIFFLSGVILLQGCAATEVENREFPVLLKIDAKEDFAEEWFYNLQKGNKKIDYNHLKVVLISRDFLEDEEAMSAMLSVLKKDKNVPLNTYVVTTDSIQEISEAETQLEEPLGNYIEKLIENSEGIKKRMFPTLGLLYQEKENRVETLFIPGISIVDEKPEITDYECYKRGQAMKQVETDMALLSFFIANGTEQYLLRIGKEDYVKLSNAKNQISFEEQVEPGGLIKRRVLVTIACEGEILWEMTGDEKGEVLTQLNEQVETYMAKITSDALAKGIDPANSRKLLAGGMREWYEWYEKLPDKYEEDIEIIFHMKIDWID